MRRLHLFVALSLVAGCANRNRQSVALYEGGDFAGAARIADEGLKTHPDDEGLWQMRIRAALALGDAQAVATAYATYRKQLAGEDDKDLLRDMANATLSQALKSPSAKLKVAAIDAIAAAEIQQLAEQVVERIGDDDDRVAAAAATAVLRGYPAQAAQVAKDMLRSEDPEARRIAVDGVGKKVGKLAAVDLAKAAEDPEPKVRRAAIHWLGEIKDPDVVEILVKAIHDNDETVRAAAASALARIGIGNLAELGEAALQDHATAVRMAGLDLLKAAHREDLLAKYESDPDPILAAEAAIAAKHSDAAGKAIERAVASKEWTIRAAAANVAVRALGRDGALGVAKRLAGDESIRVKLSAARVLAHAGDQATAATIFATALAQPDVMLQAATDLAEQDDARGIEALDAAVRDNARGSEGKAAAASAHRTAHKITPGLVAALADGSGVVRVEAAAVIAFLVRK